MIWTATWIGVVDLERALALGDPFEALTAHAAHYVAYQALGLRPWNVRVEEVGADYVATPLQVMDEDSPEPCLTEEELDEMIANAKALFGMNGKAAE
jgi:hypothetical protein